LYTRQFVFGQAKTKTFRKDEKAGAEIKRQRDSHHEIFAWFSARIREARARGSNTKERGKGKRKEGLRFASERSFIIDTISLPSFHSFFLSAAAAAAATTAHAAAGTESRAFLRRIANSESN
jgi:hypothetical protein